MAGAGERGAMAFPAAHFFSGLILESIAMNEPIRPCPDCETSSPEPRIEPVSRRDFIRVAGGAALAVGSLPLAASAFEPAKETKSEPESLVKTLYGMLKEEQKKEICFDWDYMDPERGLLRTRVSNNWSITKRVINSDFFSKDQQAIIKDIFEGMYNPEWHKNIYQQLADDAGGYGHEQSIAIFGQPEDNKFEFVMTGRHLTIRCDGNSTDHVAFGGPIFYGHAATDFNEPADHPNNVYWPQALAANQLYKMLDGKQQKGALVATLPNEAQVGFRGAQGGFPGLPVTEMSSDQKEHLQKVLQKLIEPYREADRAEAMECLKAQGGLDKCSLAFYQDGDIGGDKVWDCWRLEGPAFVWYFRGAPHVHVWVNVASDPAVKLNA